MYQTLKAYAISFHQSFRSSSVILIARINVLIGSAFTVLLTMSPDSLGNLSPVFKDPRVATAWIIANGIITEYGRRRPGSTQPLDPVTPYQPTDGPLK
jgi:hypothetical protein